MVQNLNELFSEVFEIERVNIEFRNKGYDIMNQFSNKLKSISDSPISLLQWSSDYNKFCISNLKYGLMMNQLSIPYASINELKNSIVKGKITTGHDFTEIIDELTFEYDYFGIIYKDGVEYSFEQFFNKYWVLVNNYLLNKTKK